MNESLSDSDAPSAIAGTRRTARELADGTIRVQIDIEPRNRKDFYDLLGDIDMPVALAPLDPKALNRAPAQKENPLERGFRSLAQVMHINGYFRNPKLWRAMHESGLYTLQTHKQWVQEQPCLMQGTSRCEGDIAMHHCTRASIPAAGPKLQPENPLKVPHWYGVPLCNEHHRNWLHSGGATREDKEQLLEHAVALMAERAKFAMKQYLGLDTLADLEEHVLREFEERIGLRSHAS